MNDLESALASVTDRTGHPIQERIDAETGHIDELRVTDDTGPLLRRALDHVAHPSAHGATGQQAAAPDAEGPTGQGPVDTPNDSPPNDSDISAGS